MANIFQGVFKDAQCVRAWDEQLRTSEWVDTDVFAEIFDFQNISYEEQDSYKKAIKEAKKRISVALAQQGMSLREQRSPKDRRKILTAYPDYNKDPLHNLRILAVIEDALMYQCAVQLTYSPSYRDSKQHIFHPHYMRVYNGRQYVYGIYENKEENKGLPFVALPFDRIDNASLTREVDYQPGDAKYYEQQMRDIMGASPNFKDPRVITVVLRTHTPTIHKLLLTKPYHHSIREIKPFTDELPGELTIHVQHTRELDNWILHYGAGIEVISPKELRAHIAHIIDDMNMRYKD
jgi:predicted DNA-binding transcriptional regulator YafY